MEDCINSPSEPQSNITEQLFALVLDELWRYFSPKFTQLHHILNVLVPHLKRKADLLRDMEIDRFRWILGYLYTNKFRRNQWYERELQLVEEKRYLRTAIKLYDQMIGEFEKPHIYKMFRCGVLRSWHEHFLDGYPKFSQNLHKTLKQFMGELNAPDKALMSCLLEHFNPYIQKNLICHE